MVLLKLNQTFRETLYDLYKRWTLNKDGYGMTVTKIKDFMFSLAENYDIELYNKDANTSLLDNYGEKTAFCPSNRVVEKRGSQRGFWRKLWGVIIMMWKNHGKMSHQLLTFFASLFHIKISRLLKIDMMSIMLEGDDDDVTHGDDVDPEESTTYIEWIVINRQT